MNVLVYTHRKNDGEMYDISTPEQEAAAYLRLFLEFDNYWSAYADLDEIAPLTACEPCEKGLHDHCIAGKNSRIGGNCGCAETKNCKDRSDQARRSSSKEARWLKLVEEARAGNAESAKKLIKERSREGYEYEVVLEAEVQDSVVALARYKKELAAEK